MIVIPFVFVSDPRGWDPAAGRERFAVWDSDCGGGEADPERHGVQSWPSVHLPAQWQTGKYTCRALTRSVRETVTRLFSVRLSLLFLLWILQPKKHKAGVMVTHQIGLFGSPWTFHIKCLYRGFVVTLWHDWFFLWVNLTTFVLERIWSADL